MRKYHQQHAWVYVLQLQSDAACGAGHLPAARHAVWMAAADLDCDRQRLRHHVSAEHHGTRSRFIFRKASTASPASRRGTSLKSISHLRIQPGEHLVVHKTGSGVYYKQDGTVVHFGPGFMQTGPTGGGVSGNTSTGSPNGSTGQPVPQQQQTPVNGKQSLQFNPDGSMAVLTPNNGQTYTATTGDIVHNASSGATLREPLAAASTIRRRRSGMMVRPR